jgi:3-oxoacyl-[acyl-carrier protein] reductase
VNLGIEGRTALVVGASRGIGMEIARELRQEGARVVTVARTGRCDFNMDLMDADQPQLLIEALAMVPPDIIVHVLGGSMGITSTLAPAAEWAKVWRFNLGIAHDINRAFLPKMQANRWGRIVHISSNAPRLNIGYCPYSTAKAALDGYVKVVSKEVSKDGVILSAVAPGIVHTPGRYYASLDSRQSEEFFNKYIPIQRWGRAEEVAKVVAFMASEHASYMAGSIVLIDGGAR